MPPKTKPKDVKSAPPLTPNSSTIISHSFKVSVSFKYAESTVRDASNTISFRTHSEWMDSVSSTLSSNLAYSESITCKVDRQKINASPGVLLYAYDKMSMVIGFAYIDCSVFCSQATTVCTCGFMAGNDVKMVFSITTTSPILVDSETLEPLLLSVSSISQFPLYDAETAHSVSQTNFIFGEIHIGDMTRRIFGSISSFSSISDPFEESSLTPSNCISTSVSTLLLFGLSTSSLKAKEDLKTSVQNICIYSEHVFSAVFSLVILKKLSGLISNKNMSDADKVITSSLSSMQTRLSTSVACGRGTFRLDSLMRDAYERRDGFNRRLAHMSSVDGVYGDRASFTVATDVYRVAVVYSPAEHPTHWTRPEDLSLNTAVTTAALPMPVTLPARQALYLTSGTELSVSAVFHRLTNTTVAADPLMLNMLIFGRVVIIFRYDDDMTLSRIRDTMTKVNTAALPTIQGSLRSYEMTAEEKTATNIGTLDLLTGFTLLDDDLRIVVLEGLYAEGKGLQSLIHSLNDASCTQNEVVKVLQDDAVRFHERLYTDFGCDLKRIRLRGGLACLSNKPEMYNRRIVDVECSGVIDQMSMLRFMPDLHTAKQINIFPSVVALCKLELMYGEAISVRDIQGSTHLVSFDTLPDVSWSDSINHDVTGRESGRVRGKVDCRNEKFDAMLSSERSTMDFLATHRDIRQAALEEGHARLLERIKDSDARIIPSRLEELQAQYKEQHNWKTVSGFVYPKPRLPSELKLHPKRPDECRIEDLKAPYEDDLFTRNLASSLPDSIRHREKGFKLTFKVDEHFGIQENIKFERSFDRDLIGHRDELPRGSITHGNSKNPNFFRSIHLGGEGHFKLMSEIAAKEKKDWHAKVVVDHHDFKVGGFSSRTKTIQIDRHKDILKDAPKQLSLKMLRGMKSHSGRHIGHESTPLTLINTGEYIANQHELVLLRSEDKAKFVTAEKGGENFVLFIHKNKFTPREQTVEYKRRHSPLRRTGEKVVHH